ncbi:OmpA family protein [Capnocytophaga catalasegens]|uniref:OmpA-like domain-containing protein n=1 Tax=Capnocytophaga catalasegens TaxID=1004260 RepID=A0AAV5AYE9_9FLAO|nr:OmpA family protein [Capnocytophaga catalasegens]GIZ16156.1 hypothetical protein RCZ03_21560 [Capnocytophaga catalasegens]GJM50900.1 hypothetical protein RCZ15_18730 [Capnocytophaga catalasegens]GJM53744.1 hypothetical protein RCZ16_20600 [Capnocytophaga catalasegens]
MKKQFLALATLVIAFTTQAQEQAYNKWSIDVNGGVNKPIIEFSSGYFTSTPNLWTVNGGVRYMANNKFGIRLAGGYDSYENGDNSQKFKSNLWNVNLQGVANLARVLSFEDWTRDIGLLTHAGFGYGQLNGDNLSKGDGIAFFVAGLTPEVRLSNRIALLIDGSIYFNARQENTFDTYSTTNRRGIQGINFTATAGLQIALGKHSVHADWFVDDRLQKLTDRLAKAESDLATLDQKLSGKEDKMIDENGNRVPDEIEKYLNDKYGNLDKDTYSNKDVARDLIEKGYINVYFDFNSSKPQTSSLWAADFVANYLRQDSSANVNVIGYADEIGGENYNQKLSAKRAEVIKQLLVDRGVDASRLNFEGKGEDNSVNKNSANARQMARRVTFSF